ncbi:MAG: transporter substrate-binding domain-containing protein [Prevotella sp.]|nr:transporter substrate-binding domain-containing protein [Prevotella sp.]
MIKRLTFTLIITIVCSLASWGDNLGYSKFNPLRIGLDLDYAPMEYVDKDGMPQGLDVKMTQELMKRLDVPYTYSLNSWENISGDVINQRVDLAMMVYSPYRKNIVNYSRAVFHLYYQVVYRIDDVGSKFDMRNIEGKEVAYMKSRPITDTLQRAGAVLHVVRDLPKALKDLSRGKYDAVICYRYQAKYHIKDQELTNLVAEDLTLPSREYCYVSGNMQLIEAINHELDAMEKEGIIDEIYGGYISHLGEFHIPRWVWYTIAFVLLVFLLAVVVQQYIYGRRLKREMMRAQKSERLKTVFLANVSHALRTPLNAIIGFSDMLSSIDLEMISKEERQEMLGMINKNGHELLYFINELLQLSDIEGNGLQYQRIDTNVKDAIEGYRMELASTVSDGVELIVDAPQADMVAVVDPNLMRIVTTHLLTNAIKHTRQGSIVVRSESKDGGLYVSVADTGDGLSDKLKENIFTLLNDKNTFVQEENPGLGLSICKAIIDASGGRIGVDSMVGQGSTFWYWVPCKIK